MSTVIDPPGLVPNPGPIDPASRYGLINALLFSGEFDQHIWSSFLPDEDTGIIFNLPTCPVGITPFDPLCGQNETLPKSAPLSVYQSVISETPVFWEVGTFCSTVPRNIESDIQAAAYDQFNGNLELDLEAIYASRIVAATTNLPLEPSALCAYGAALIAASIVPGSGEFLIHVDRLVATQLLHNNVVEVIDGKLYDRITGSLVIVWRSQPPGDSVTIEVNSRARLYLSDWIELPTPSDEVARTNTRVFRVERGALIIGPEAACAVFSVPYSCS